MSGLQIDIAGKVFPGAAGAPGKAVFEQLHLEIAAGTFLCILGPSGCGKTTLLNLVAGLDSSFQGRIDWTGPAGSGAPKLGYVFQQPTLLPWRRVGENLRWSCRRSRSAESWTKPTWRPWACKNTATAIRKIFPLA